MRLLVGILGFAIVLAAGTTWAEDSNVPAPAGKAAVQPAPSMDATVQMKRMDQQMKKMRALQDRMVRAATPDERQKIMAEQHKAIQDGMRVISQMMAAMSGSGALGEKADPSDPNGVIQMMQTGIDLMALMTQMMMDQLGLITPPKGPTSAPPK